MSDTTSKTHRLQASAPVVVIKNSGSSDQAHLTPASKAILAYIGSGTVTMSWDGSTDYTLVQNGEAKTRSGRLLLTS